MVSYLIFNFTSWFSEWVDTIFSQLQLSSFVHLLKKTFTGDIYDTKYMASIWKDAPPATFLAALHREMWAYVICSACVSFVMHSYCSSLVHKDIPTFKFVPVKYASMLVRKQKIHSYRSNTLKKWGRKFDSSVTSHAPESPEKLEVPCQSFLVSWLIDPCALKGGSNNCQFAIVFLLFSLMDTVMTWTAPLTTISMTWLLRFHPPQSQSRPQSRFQVSTLFACVQFAFCSSWLCRPSNRCHHPVRLAVLPQQFGRPNKLGGTGSSSKGRVPSPYHWPL